jgi:lipid II:glycine glycyltransferase (peptidoglycan interpeptide bridge formation enzyme)
MQAPEWNRLIGGLTRPHLLQTAQWAQAKAPFGWTAYQRTWEDDHGQTVAAAQLLQREIRLPIINRSLCMFYVPKGPTLADWSDAELRQRVIADIKDFAAGHGAFTVKIDPDLPLGYGVPGEEGARDNPAGMALREELQAAGWRYSNEQVQMPNTQLVDLTQSEDELLAAMKQKTRYNVRLAARKGVEIRRGSPADFPAVYQMYAETAVRDGFVIRSEAYYRTVWDSFYEAGLLIPLLADVEGETVAGLMLFVFGEQSWYIYGMSRDAHRDKMPNYLLQWEAMRASKAAGCHTYDLWGAPDEFNESDPMWGVYRFKQGLGAYEVRGLGAWDYALQPAVYTAYTQILPRIIAVMRWRGRRQTAGQVAGIDA